MSLIKYKTNLETKFNSVRFTFYSIPIILHAGLVFLAFTISENYFNNYVIYILGIRPIDSLGNNLILIYTLSWDIKNNIIVIII